MEVLPPGSFGRMLRENPDLALSLQHGWAGSGLQETVGLAEQGEPFALGANR